MCLVSAWHGEAHRCGVQACVCGSRSAAAVRLRCQRLLRPHSWGSDGCRPAPFGFGRRERAQLGPSLWRCETALMSRRRFGGRWAAGPCVECVRKPIAEFLCLPEGPASADDSGLTRELRVVERRWRVSRSENGTVASRFWIALRSRERSVERARQLEGFGPRAEPALMCSAWACPSSWLMCAGLFVSARVSARTARATWSQSAIDCGAFGLYRRSRCILLRRTKGSARV